MREKSAWVMNGFIAILVISVLLLVGILSFLEGQIMIGILSLVIGVALSSGLTRVEPNQSIIVSFFGKYIGSIREEGMVIAIPFSKREVVSLRVHNKLSNSLKINDVNGRLIEVAAVIVYKVVDSAKAVFAVDNYEEFVDIQSKTAIKIVAAKYPYESDGNVELTLRRHVNEVSRQLSIELQERLKTAGIKVIEARLTRVSYDKETNEEFHEEQLSKIHRARKHVGEAVEIIEVIMDRMEAAGTFKLTKEHRKKMINDLLVTLVPIKEEQSIQSKDMSS